MKTNLLINSALKLSALALATTLVACGGGGGGGDTATGTVTPGPIVVTPVDNGLGNLLNTIPDATYTGSTAAQAYAELNAYRAGGGFGALRQSFLLDKAAANHLNYFFKKWGTIPAPAYTSTGLPLLDASGNQVTQFNLNAAGYSQVSKTKAPELEAHVEVRGEAEFTGELANDRASAVGYGFQTYEIIGFQRRFTKAISCVASLLNAPYHRALMLDPQFTEVGISAQEADSLAGSDLTCVINPSIGPKKGITPLDWVGIYPQDKATGVLNYSLETPNPWSDYEKLGTAPSIFVTEGHKLQVDSFTIAGPDGKALEAAILTRRNDKHRFVIDNQAFLIPNGYLQPSTTYTVTFRGKDIDTRGKTEKLVSRDWSFTTDAHSL